jgi:hypothetical protein
MMTPEQLTAEAIAIGRDLGDRPRLAFGRRTTRTLADVHATFRRWLGVDSDLDAISATLAAAAVERLDGDPLWLLLVSGSGNAKPKRFRACPRLAPS